MNGKILRHRGFALVTAMIFLVLLTLIALVALRSSGLEATSSGNNAQRIEAFESSETARFAVEDALSANLYNHGWPTTVPGGTVPTSNFGALPTGLTILFPTSNCSTASGSVGNWYAANSEDTAGIAFSPTQLDCDAVYSVTNGTGSAQIGVYSQLAVYKLRVAPAPGSSLAAASGSLGFGKGAAAGGTNIYFYLRSRGNDLKGSAGNSNFDTSADFRYVPQN